MTWIISGSNKKDPELLIDPKLSINDWSYVRQSMMENLCMLNLNIVASSKTYQLSFISHYE